MVILTAGTFGAINASPWFNLAIAALFVLLALAMFDVITVDFSRWSSRIRFGEESRGTFLLAFRMGGVAALLPGACEAPVVIQVVLFASDLYARGNALALALPFFLGVGMALPWPIAGAGLSTLPKPGRWMVRVKQAFGVFILATALYYGYLVRTGLPRPAPARRCAAGRCDATARRANAPRPLDRARAGDALQLIEPRYENLGQAEAARLFGDGFPAAVVNQPPGRWAGPIASGYGAHLVRVEALVPGRLPSLDEVRPLVEREWANARRQALAKAQYDRLRAKYRIEVQMPAAAKP